MIDSWEHQLIEERSDLERRCLSLYRFLSSTEAITLPPAEIETLKKQKDLMITYLEILDERIQNLYT